ncbi:hypothetical protein V7S43_009819 [Phytophthora oleae]|uniref:WRKY19-like zinc finger domain-containing protein n=1 Tax=Phytophthora oleae TaxID=2107226 RepID=A0ABD3FE25_9STRA
MEAEPKDLDGLGTGNGQPPDAPDGRKLGLPFILNVPIRPSAPTETRPLNEKTEADKDAKEEKRRRRMCKHEGCSNYIVHKGLCCRHGGGKKCSVEGCSSSAKHRGRCWKHGGSVRCKRGGCDKKAKARGLCWAHGGGTKCRDSECTKVAVSNGFCWAHGGGKRCGCDGCNKPAYERTHNLCETHYAQLRNTS